MRSIEDEVGDNKPIWIRTPKCAGTSIMRILKHKPIQIVKFGEVEKCKKNTINFNEAYKFAFVRNPFDRCVSSWRYSLKKRWFGGNFNQFVESKFCDVTFLPLTRHLSLDPLDLKIDYLDFIGKVENIQEDFNIVCDKIGISKQKLPHRNRTKHKHYTKYYDEETKSIVAEKFAKDIEMFGYEFGE